MKTAPSVLRALYYRVQQAGVCQCKGRCEAAGYFLVVFDIGDQFEVTRWLSLN